MAAELSKSQRHEFYRVDRTQLPRKHVTAADIMRYEAFAKAENWDVMAVRSDPDHSESAWLRTGLLSAITMICHLRADGVVMPQSVFDQLSDDDCSFVFNRLNHWGGFLRTIPDEGEGEL